MKKVKQISKSYIQPEEELSRVEEPYVPYPSVKKIQAAIADFSYSRFQKIANKIPFTLSDWASILHLSERTLQRYAKDNRNFEGIYVDRIIQIQKIINLGLEVFSTPDDLYKWLKTPKNVLGEEVTFESLSHSDGIMQVSDQLGRIQQGVYA